MKLNEFQELSKRTMPYNGQPANQAEFENMLGNYAMGLVGEAIEFMYATRKGKNPDLYTEEEIDEAFEEMLKEMGDILHYAVGLLACLDETVDESKLIENDKGPIYIAGDISEMVKKHLYHRHALDKSLIIEKIHQLIYAMDDIFNAENHISVTMQMNINKLKTRYPEKFNTTDSINRVDVASE